MEKAQKKKRTRKVPERKVSRACVHCRNAHITCDDNRPCSRCVKKGLQDSCVDAPRKTKKYLIGMEEYDMSGSPNVDDANSSSNSTSNDKERSSSSKSMSMSMSSMQMPTSAPTSSNTILGPASMQPIVPAIINTESPRIHAPAQQQQHQHFNIYPRNQSSFMNVNNISSNVNVLNHPNMGLNMDLNINMDMSNPRLNLTHRNSSTSSTNTNSNNGNSHNSPIRRVDFSTMSNGFIKRSPTSKTQHIYNSIDGTIENNHNRPTSNNGDQPEINFLSSAADSEYAILGNIIDQTMFSNTHNSNTNTQKYVSPALSTTSDDFEYLNYQPLMTTANANDSPNSVATTTPGSIKGGCNSPFVKPLQPIEMRFKSKSGSRIKIKTEPDLDITDDNGSEHLNNESSDMDDENKEEEDDDNDNANYDDDDENENKDFPGGDRKRKKKRKLKYSDLYPSEPYCDASTNQYFIGTMSTIDGIKTHTFPEVVKQISKFKNEHPKKFKERNRRSAISFSIGILDDVAVPEIEGESSSSAAAAANNASSSTSSTSDKDNDKESSKDKDTNGNNNARCGLLYHEPSEIYEKVKQAFTYVKPYHDLNLYLKSRFPKQDLVQMSKSIAEYRPSFIAGMIKLKEDDLIFAEQCFQRTLLEYDGYIGISGTPTLVWRRSSQIAYVGDEFCILTGWSKEDLLGKSTFAVEIMDDKSCVEYFKIFSKIAFGDMSGDTITECTLLTPKGESIRTNSTWTLKRDVFGIPMMIIATFLPILT